MKSSKVGERLHGTFRGSETEKKMGETECGTERERETERDDTDKTLL